MKVLWPVPEAFWWEVAAACPEATFFHTPLWTRLITAIHPEWRDASVGFELDGGARAVLPLLETARPIRGLFRDFVSTFGGCYGGLIADVPLQPPSLQKAWQVVLGSGRLARLQLTGNPLSEQWGPPRAAAEREDFTHLLDLSPGYDAVERSFSESTRRWIRKADQVGMAVEAARDEGSFRAYYAIYEESLRRWADRATSSYPWTLFEAGFRLGLQNPGTMELWLAKLEERVVAGAWVFYWNRHAVNWHGATGSDALSEGAGRGRWPRDFRAGAGLHAAVIRDACARGAAFYDFNPSGGHEGVAHFKSGFGTHRCPVPRLEIAGPLFPGASALVKTLRR